MGLKRLKILQALSHSNTSAGFKCALLDAVAHEKNIQGRAQEMNII